jgi:membrane-associated phospholipid phosphatase
MQAVSFLIRLFSRSELMRLALVVSLVAPALQSQTVDPDQTTTLPQKEAANFPAHDSRDPNIYFANPTSDRALPKKFATNLLLDQKDFWTSPFRINKQTAKWWVLLGVGTAALIAADHPISQALPFSGTSVDFGNNASHAGQWYTVFPAAGLLYATGLAAHNEKLAETGALSLQALAGAGIVTNVLKVTARRERPTEHDGGGHFETGGLSFPSGHSAQAWALATVIADEYGNHKWVPYMAYSYAALVSTSRVLAQQHFTSDVLVGGAIGFFIGRYVVQTQRLHRDHLRGNRSRLWTPSITPSFYTGTKQIAASWNH